MLGWMVEKRRRAVNAAGRENVDGGVVNMGLAADARDKVIALSLPRAPRAHALHITPERRFSL